MDVVDAAVEAAVETNPDTERSFRIVEVAPGDDEPDGAVADAAAAPQLASWQQEDLEQGLGPSCDPNSAPLKK